MNPIVTVEMYRVHSPDCDLTDNELTNILDVSQQTVNTNVCGRLALFETFDEETRENVTKAVMAQADYIAANFGSDISESIPQSATIGSFSYSNGSGSGSMETAGSSPVSLAPVALMYLRTTGLMYRGGICAV